MCFVSARKQMTRVKGYIKGMERNSLREINIAIIPKLSKIKHIDGMHLHNT